MPSPDDFPDWVLRIVRPGDVLPDGAAAMDRAVALGLASIASSGGGPFAALITTAAGRVVSIGWNVVIPTHDPTAHAEVTAIRRAGAALDTWAIGSTEPLTLWTTCAPCLMCTGAIHWAGIARVVAATYADDAEAIGFREGPAGCDAAMHLRALGVAYEEGVERERALELFRRYAGPIYNGRTPAGS